MTTVLWISAVGGSLLFFALAGLVAFMYLLTSPWLFPVEGEGEPPMRRMRRRKKRGAAEAEAATAAAAAATAAAAEAEAEVEQERIRRAVALAVATAIAEETQIMAMPLESPHGWRQLHRARRLVRLGGRQRARV